MTDKLEPTQADRDLVKAIYRFSRIANSAGFDDALEAAARHRTTHSGEGRSKVSAADAFEMGYVFGMALRGQNLEDSRAVGRLLMADSFKAIHGEIDDAIKKFGFDSFQNADSGICQAKRIIRAALSDGEGRSYGTGEDKQLVPREPTEEMYLAAFNSDHWGGKVPIRRVVDEIWTAMLRAALAPQGDGEIERLRAEIRTEVINTPETADFMHAVPIEAMHQRERWGASHDAGKTPFDWFWLIGYLAQKAASSAVAGDKDKALHHTISTAAALANWHAALAGVANEMRPGIGPGNGGEKPGSAHSLAAALQRDTGGEHG